MMPQEMQIYGSIVALATPLTLSTDIDWPALDRLVDFHIENGTHAIVAVGTTGESATLAVDEHIGVVERVVSRAAGRIPVIAGAGANSTQEAIELSLRSAHVGADALLSVVPYYNKPTQRGLFQHFAAIADAAPVPVLLYNVPGRTVADLQNETAIELMRHSNIIGIKDATGDVARGRELIQGLGDSGSVFSGDDASAFDLMQAGAAGNISVTANVCPAQMSALCEAVRSGDIASADAMNTRLAPINQALFVEANPIPVKYLLSYMGLMEDVLRLPLTSLSKPARAEVIAAYNAAQ